MNNWESLLPVVSKLANYYCFGNKDLREDLMQVGILGALKAIRKHEANHISKTKLSSFAYIYVRGNILHYLRTNPLEKPLPLDEEEALALPDRKPSFTGLYDTKDYIEYLFKALQPKERMIIEQVYLNDITQDKIAKSLGTNKMAICRMVNKALKKMAQRVC